MYRNLLSESYRAGAGPGPDSVPGSRPRSRRASVVESLCQGGAGSVVGAGAGAGRADMDQVTRNAQRTKIGLQCKSEVRAANRELETRKMVALEFIQSQFKRKECCEYRHEDTEWTRTLPFHEPCYCGAEEKDHPMMAGHGDGPPSFLVTSVSRDADGLDTCVLEPGAGLAGYTAPTPPTPAFSVSPDPESEAEKEKNKEEIPWNPTTAIKEFPTNAYGTIEFSDNLLKAAKYVRLADDTRMAVVREYLETCWQLLNPRPFLALSILGGAKNFQMDGRNKEKFKAGLVAAARVTNAWVITGGTNTGAMKLVGEAVNEGQFVITEGEKIRRGLKAIGIVPWGYVLDKEKLVNPYPYDFHTARYHASSTKQPKQPSPLNPHHTHFLLVDDGRRNRYGDAGPRNFRAAFERSVQEPGPEGLGVPVVTLLLEGGPDALFEVRTKLAAGQPCLVVEGSGRSADLLGYAVRLARQQQQQPGTGQFSLSQEQRGLLQSRVKQVFADRVTGQYAERRLNKFTGWVEDCLHHCDLITVYDINTEEDLDKKILLALLSGEVFNPLHVLHLSMVWDRVDIAEERIYRQRGLAPPPDQLNTLMAQALLMDRLAFVQLLVMNGFSIHKETHFDIDVGRLRQLYNDSVADHPHLLTQLQRRVGPCSYITLSHIHTFLNILLKSHSHWLYEGDTPENMKKMKERLKKEPISNPWAMPDISEERFDHPFLELFIWAVLNNKAGLRDYFWEKSGHPLVAAILAASFYEVLVDWYKTVENKGVLQLKEEFQTRATEVMEIAFAKDFHKGLSLVERNTARFGQRSLIQTSYDGNLQSIVSNPPCRRSVLNTWQRGMWNLNTLPMLAAILCPLFILLPSFEFISLGVGGVSLTFRQKIYVFYHAPIVKYTSNLLTYIAFLLLYTYIVLYNFGWGFQASEVVAYVWMFILILEETREVFAQPYRSLYQKLCGHLSCPWNKFDLAICSIAILGFVLKQYQSTFPASRVLFAVNAALLYCRLFRVYHASWRLGPKLIVFHRMVWEIVVFMMLLIIFILGYGVASQALLHPAAEFSLADLPTMLSNVIYLPYWQMYGELSLEEIQHENKTNETICEEKEFCEDFTYYNHVTILFLGIYLLIGNVMLLNLLIAIFTAVFESVQENSKQVWRMEMYRLAEEYDRKPVLPVPLVIFEYVWRTGQAVYAVCSNPCMSRDRLQELALRRALESLDLIEIDSLNQWLGNRKKQENDTLETQIKGIAEKMEKDVETNHEEQNTENLDQSEKIHEVNPEPSGETTPLQSRVQAIETKLSKLEQSSNDTMEKLNEILLALKTLTKN